MRTLPINPERAAGAAAIRVVDAPSDELALGDQLASGGARRRFGRVISAKSAMVGLALAATLLQAQNPLPGTMSRNAIAADLPTAENRAMRNQAQQLFALGNQARAAQGLAPLEWDPALAAAALTHCVRMAAEGPLSHQYAGEPDLSERAGQAGAHFSLIEENIAEAPQPNTIHQLWMNSPLHRENLLNPGVDRVGVAVVARGNQLYAVADFGHFVAVLTPEQVEAKVADLVASTGVTAHGNSPGARDACAQDHGLPVALDNRRPEFIMRWQDAELHRLPGALLDRIATGKYREAAVGSCPSESYTSTFTVYRVAVLLLKPQTAAPRTYLSQK
jgi:uncharacterized protein YkwD